MTFLQVNSNPIRGDIARRLKLLRLDANISQEQLSERLEGIPTRSVITKLEDEEGDFTVSTETYFRILVLGFGMAPIKASQLIKRWTWLSIKNELTELETKYRITPLDFSMFLEEFHEKRSDIYKDTQYRIFGKTPKGDFVFTTFDSTPTLIIAGYAGAGKSKALHSMLCELFTRNTPETLQVYFCDPKSELKDYSGLKFLKAPVAETADEVLTILAKVKDEGDRRIELFREAQCESIEGYNIYCQKNGLTQLPKILVVIEEIAQFTLNMRMSSSKKDRDTGSAIEMELTRMARKHRAQGIFLIIVTERMNAVTIPVGVRGMASVLSVWQTEMDGNIAFGLHGDKTSGTSNLKPRTGQALLAIGGHDIQKIQLPYIGDHKTLQEKISELKSKFGE